ncbi:TPA: fimbrial chaperone [Photobacterium damselae]
MKIILYFFMLFLSVTSFSTYAAFILNGTRYVYNEGDNNISMQISNESNKTYGGQVWIDNISMPKNYIGFVAIPSFFKVEGNKNQIIRVMKIGDNLPKNKESIFWLNVQEIPPIDKNSEQNAIVLAVNTKVKLIYRPKSLAKERLNAERNIKIKNNNNKLIIENPTPYYFAISEIKINNKAISLSKKISNEISLFSPYSEISLGNFKSENDVKFKIEAIDDYGATNTYEIK